MAHRKYVAIANPDNLYGCGTSVVMTSDAIILTPATSQSPTGNCVTSGGSGTIRADSSRQLMASGCAIPTQARTSLSKCQMSIRSRWAIAGTFPTTASTARSQRPRRRRPDQRAAGVVTGRCRRGRCGSGANAQAAKLEGHLVRARDDRIQPVQEVEELQDLMITSRVADNRPPEKPVV